MTGSALQLLRRLQPAVPPGHPDSERVRQQPRSPIERESFDQLLTLVSDGHVASGRDVAIAFEPETEFTNDELDRLASASDLAEAHGANSAVLVMDGRGFILDVRGRQLTEELTTGDARILPVDVAVQVAAANDDDSGAALGPTAPPPAAITDELARRNAG